MGIRNGLMVAALVGVGLVSQPAALGQSRSPYYERGVNAFFEGRSEDCVDSLSAVLASDPRNIAAYYFRGLAKLRTGSPIAARADFVLGASVEAQSAGRTRSVDAALARVQGDARGVLDGVRREVKQSPSLRVLPIHRATALVLTGAEQAALRPQFHLPMEALASASSASELATLVHVEPVPIAKLPEDPFQDDPGSDFIVPPEARGSVTASQLGGAIFRAFGSLIPQPPAQLREQVTRTFGMGGPAANDAFVDDGMEMEGGEGFGGFEEMDLGAAAADNLFDEPLTGAGAAEPVEEAAADDAFEDIFGDVSGDEEDPFAGPE